MVATGMFTVQDHIFYPKAGDSTASLPSGGSGDFHAAPETKL